MDTPDLLGYTALHHSTMHARSSTDLARILLENGASPDVQDRFGSVPLLYAFMTNRVPAVELLMQHGARMDVSDADDTTPDNLYIKCGAEVTPAVRKWERKRAGQEAKMEQAKRCDRCLKEAEGTTTLKQCARCRTARYCTAECQRTCAMIRSMLYFTFNGRTSRSPLEGAQGILHTI